MRARIDGAGIVVTGASSGIGRAIAEQLAPRARALALVARRRERLDALAAELRGRHPRLEVHVVPCDLGDPAATRALAPALTAALGEVDVLVNNAGLGRMGVFDRTTLDDQLGMIEVNVTSLVTLTHALLPAMVARGRGAILNVSSGFGMTFAPGFATYVGTKHFVTGFTEALRVELAGTGVVITQVCPGPVATEFEEVAGNFTGRPIPPAVQISAAQCAAESIAGLERGRAIVYPGALLKVGMALLPLAPRWLQRAALTGSARWLRAREEQLASAPTTDASAPAPGAGQP